MTQAARQTIGRLFVGGVIFFILFWLITGVVQTAAPAAHEQLLPMVQLDPTFTPTITLTPSPTSTPVCVPSNTVIGENPTLEQNIAREINLARFNNGGKSTLDQPWQLSQVAQIHVADMRNNNFVGHQGTDNKFAQDRMQDNCYFPASDQEIVWGGATDDPDAIVASWVADPDWNRAMMDSEMNDFGVGYRSGNTGNTHAHYLVVNFGTELSGRNQTTADQAPACILTLENELGSGTWRIYDEKRCP